MRCFLCLTIVEGPIGHRECPKCHVFEKINENGNPIWMKNGKIISAPVEEQQAYDDMLTTKEAIEKALRGSK